MTTNLVTQLSNLIASLQDGTHPLYQNKIKTVRESLVGERNFATAMQQSDAKMVYQYIIARLRDAKLEETFYVDRREFSSENSLFKFLKEAFSREKVLVLLDGISYLQQDTLDSIVSLNRIDPTSSPTRLINLPQLKTKNYLIINVPQAFIPRVLTRYSMKELKLQLAQSIPELYPLLRLKGVGDNLKTTLFKDFGLVPVIKRVIKDSRIPERFFKQLSTIDRTSQELRTIVNSYAGGVGFNYLNTLELAMIKKLASFESRNISIFEHDITRYPHQRNIIRPGSGSRLLDIINKPEILQTLHGIVNCQVITMDQMDRAVTNLKFLGLASVEEKFNFNSLIYMNRSLNSDWSGRFDKKLIERVHRNARRFVAEYEEEYIGSKVEEIDETRPKVGLSLSLYPKESRPARQTSNMAQSILIKK